MARLRVECPWDAEQTHRSLAKHLIEETAEVVEAIEAGSTDTDIPDDDLREELGDLLLQIYFHAEIASSQHRFDIEDVAKGICDKLVRRHPWVFDGADNPEDMMGTWEAAKQAEKQRASALEGIPETLSTLARAGKVVARTRHVHLDVPMAAEPITAEQLGTEVLRLVQRAQASGIDPDQATRDALRALERAILTAEAPSEEAC
ncbi:MAG: MazG family protein [Brooklawnia sp.]|uniref:MazG family protein n=1 Tax=Brooklawnia sp. TaxID=2699740 RepID=UPI003C726889